MKLIDLARRVFALNRRALRPPPDLATLIRADGTPAKTWQDKEIEKP
jgi:hypothetical protein